jgi:hypothetical protein
MQDLDEFLRKIWLECCNHSSAFSYYNEDSKKTTLIPMTDSIGELNVGDGISHDFDRKNTTTCDLYVMESTMSAAQPGSVRLLARNNPVEFVCDTCGKPATRVSGLTYSENWKKRYFCLDCAQKEQDYGNILHIVNSPRTGVCHYEGKDDTFQLDNANLITA